MSADRHDVLAGDDPYRSAFEHAAIGVGLISLQGRWLLVNDALCELLGFPRDQLLRMSYTEHAHPEDLRAVSALVAQLIAGHREASEVQTRLRARDGRTIWTRLSLSLACDRSGAPWHLIAHLQDVTAARAAQESLAQAEERQRLLLDSLPDTLVALYDTKLRCLLLQGPALRDTELRAEDYIGQPISDTLPSGQAQQLIPLVVAALAGHSGASEYTSGLTGLTYDLRVEPFHSSDGVIAGAFAVARNVTEQRRREQEARRLATIVESSEDAIVATDLDATITHWNRGAVRLFGYPVAEAVGRSYEMLMGADELPDGVANWRRVRSGETLAPFDTRRVRRDGTVIDVSVSLSPIHDAHGAVIGVSANARDIGPRVRAERERQTAQERFERAFVTAPSGMAISSLEGRFTDVNDALCTMTGYTRAQLVATTFEAITHPDERGIDRAYLAQLLAGELDHYAREKRYLHRSGSVIWGLVHVTLLRGDDGEPREVLAQVSDITTQKRAADALAEAERRFRITTEHAPIGIALLTLDDAGHGTVSAANQALGELIGYRAQELVGRALGSLVHPDDVAVLGRDLAALGAHPQARMQLEVRLRHREGHIPWVLLSGAAVPGGAGNPTRQAVVHAVDIGERKRFEGQLQYLADHDVLTGLFNRRRFEEEVARSAAQMQRYGGTGAVLLIDLDGFKHVNDSLGHSYGDELITRIGAVLRSAVRETDVSGRLGGDEFAVMLPNADPEEALSVANKLLNLFETHPITLSNGRQTRVTASIGVTTYAAGSELSAEELIVEADVAMYEAKEAGKNRAAMYDRGSGPRATVAVREPLLAQLRHAIDHDDFALLAQPIRPIQGGGPARFELLLRLRGTEGELIAPGAFLDIAERLDLVQRIDRWVFAQAVRLLRAHERAGHDISLSVNMSGRTLTDPRIRQDIEAELTGHPVRPDRLIVEVTETAAIVNIEQAQRLAAALRGFGCRFALDDFGAGFASFYYLKHLDFDYLKIDGEFIRALHDNVTDQLVVRSVVAIARELGAKTIAEFVSGPAVLDRLGELGVDFGQGYYLGRPRPLEEVLPALRER